MKWEYEEKIAELETKAERLGAVITECEGYLKYLEERGLALNEREKTRKRSCEITLRIAKGETDVD